MRMAFWRAAALVTKEFSVPVTYGTEMATNAFRPNAKCNGVDDLGVVFFKVPHDFNSIVSAELIVRPAATQAAADWDIYCKYEAEGEAQGIHNENDTATTYNVTNNITFAVDISGVLSNLAADDYVGVQLVQNAVGHDLEIYGVRFRYN